MPVELHLAATKLISNLDNIRAAITINGMGLNCDATLPTTTRTGHEISNSLAQFDKLKEIAGMPPDAQARTSLNYSLNNVLYTLRVDSNSNFEFLSF